MTIYTKQNAENDEKKVAPMLEVQVTVDSAPPMPKKVPAVTGSARIDRRVREVRKRRLCIQLFLLLGCLLGLSLCLFGTLYLYRIRGEKKYDGWCGVRYTSQYQGKSSELESSTRLPMRYLDEEIHVDGDRETLKVPKFYDNDEATFLLDFNQEVTFIRDETDQVCYVKPLDMEKVPRPQTLLDLLWMYERGDLIPDAEEVRENYRFLPTPLSYQNVTAKYGEYFANFCSGYNTYELIEVTEDEIMTTTTTASTVEFSRIYIMYPGGQWVIRYRIVF